MTDTLSFLVPWSALCSDNRKFINGQFILTKEYRESKQAIGLLAQAAARKAKWARAEGPLMLEVVVREPDRRRRDLNWSKNAKDGIGSTEAVWWDDSQVRWEVWRFVEPPDRARAGAVVTIRALDLAEISSHTDGDADATMGRPRDVRGAVAPGLQRARRVRRGAATADESAEQTPERTRRGRGKGRASLQRGARGAVTGGEGAAEAEAGAVRSPEKATRHPHHHERTQ